MVMYVLEQSLKEFRGTHYSDKQFGRIVVRYRGPYTFTDRGLMSTNSPRIDLLANYHTVAATGGDHFAGIVVIFRDAYGNELFRQETSDYMGAVHTNARGIRYLDLAPGHYNGLLWMVKAG
jgi:hypothetical protein